MPLDTSVFRGEILHSPNGTILVGDQVDVLTFLHFIESSQGSSHSTLHPTSIYSEWVLFAANALHRLNYIRAWQLVYIPPQAWSTHFQTPLNLAETIGTALNGLRILTPSSFASFSQSSSSSSSSEIIRINSGSAPKVSPFPSLQTTANGSAAASLSASKQSGTFGLFANEPDPQPQQHALSLLQKYQAKLESRRMILEGWAVRGLALTNGLISLFSCGVLALAAISRDTFWLFWVCLCAVLLVIAAVARYGANRLPSDVLAETQRLKLVPYDEASMKDWKQFDGLETIGQRIVLAAAYAYLLVCVCIVVLVCASANRLGVEGLWTAGIGASIVPIVFAFNAFTIRVVSALEWLQSLSELLSLMESLTLSVLSVGALWVINRTLEANQIEALPGVGLDVPVAVFSLAMLGNVCAVYTFIAAWRENKAMLRLSTILQGIYLLPLAITMISLVATSNLGSYVITHCHTFLASLDKGFFESFVSCQKYNGVGLVRNAAGQVIYRNGPGEAIFCGEGSANKLRAAVAWEVNPVRRANDGKWVDYYGCLDYACCVALAQLANEAYDIIIGAAATLVFVVILEWATLAYLKAHAQDEEEAHHFRHHAAPFLGKLLFTSLALLVASLCILGYSHLGVVVIPNIETISLKTVSRSEACEGGSCPPATPCDSSLCCVNGIKDGAEVDIDCGRSCSFDNGRLCPTGSRCEEDSDCLSHCCVNASCVPCALNRSNVDQFDAACSNGRFDAELFETCPSGGGDVCRRRTCEEGKEEVVGCRSNCSAIGYLCGEGEGCEVDLDCIEGLRCSSATKRCTQDSRIFQTDGFVSLELLGSTLRSGDGAALGSNCTKDADCSTLHCELPTCHTYFDAGPYSSRFRACYFPFIYQGTWFYGCIDARQFPPPGSKESIDWSVERNGTHQLRYWCSTEPEADEDSWGFCDCSEPVNVSKEVQTCDCEVPFTYQNATYASCLDHTELSASDALVFPAKSPSSRFCVNNDNQTIRECECLTKNRTLTKVCQPHDLELSKCNATTNCGDSCSLIDIACGEGLHCTHDRDCTAGMCRDDVCVSCNDGLVNGFESDIDCGGIDCPRCSIAKNCTRDQDCSSGLCWDGSCSGCEDGIRNGQETCVDGGGSMCGLQGRFCEAGDRCATAEDCAHSLTCIDNFCVNNTDAEEVPCGNSYAMACSLGRACEANLDCQTKLCISGVCAAKDLTTLPASCFNGEFDVNETCIDGGGICAAYDKLCEVGSKVGNGNNADCASGIEREGECVATMPIVSCFDGVKNGDETDIDCGGICKRCNTMQSCSQNEDCISNICSLGQCISCYDGIANGAESDVDCGGDQCAKRCEAGQRCGSDRDCLSSICENNLCSTLNLLVSINCIDNGVLDAWETDVDCGGECVFVGKPCSENQRCIRHRDCGIGMVCVNSACALAERSSRFGLVSRNNGCNQDCAASTNLQFLPDTTIEAQGRCSSTNKALVAINSTRAAGSFCGDSLCIISLHLSTLSESINISVVEVPPTISVERVNATALDVTGPVDEINLVLRSVVVCEQRSLRVLEAYSVQIEAVDHFGVSGECSFVREKTVIKFSTLVSPHALPLRIQIQWNTLAFGCNKGHTQAEIWIQPQCWRWHGGSNCNAFEHLARLNVTKAWTSVVANLDFRLLIGSSVALHIIVGDQVNGLGTYVYTERVFTDKVNFENVVVPCVPTQEMNVTTPISNAPSASPTGSTQQPSTLDSSFSPSTFTPTVSPKSTPTVSPAAVPTVSPTSTPTVSPASTPTVSPTSASTVSSTTRNVSATASPTSMPTTTPSMTPSVTWSPTGSPTEQPSSRPSMSPSSGQNRGVRVNLEVYISLCGGPRVSSEGVGLTNASYAKDARLRFGDSDDIVCTEQSETSCELPEGKSDVQVIAMDSENGWEPVSVEVECAEHQCSCLDPSTCAWENGRLVVYAKSLLEEGQIRACLSWDVSTVRDLDLVAGFQVGGGQACEISTVSQTCGNASLLQWNDDALVFGKEGLVISTVYRTVYTLSVRNYVEDAATEESDLVVTLEGFGINQPLAFTMPSAVGSYDSWPEGGIQSNGMFRNSSRYLRLACIEVGLETAMVRNVPLFSSTAIDPMESCEVDLVLCDAAVEFPTVQEVFEFTPTSAPTMEVGQRDGTTGIVGTTRAVELSLELVRTNVSAESSGRVFHVDKYAYAIESSWGIALGDIETALGICPRAVSFDVAQGICGSTFTSPMFVQSAAFPTFSWVCKAEEISSASARNRSCFENHEYIWTGSICAPTDGKNGREVVSSWPACGQADCKEGYPGERCWHDGSKRKSCRNNWERRGVFRNGTYVNTLALCELCAVDEDCRLYVYQGVYPKDPVVYSFDGDNIPRDKVPGICYQGGKSCGDVFNYTVQDGFCETPNCSCLNHNLSDVGETDEGLLRHGAMEPTCVEDDSGMEAGLKCCHHVADHTSPHSREIAVFDYPLATDNLFGDKVFLRASIRGNPSLANNGFIGVTSIEVDPYDCSSTTFTAVSTDWPNAKHISVQSPKSPGTYRACLFRPSSSSVCVLPALCKVSGVELSLQTGSCTSFTIRCGNGWDGERCFTCNGKDSDGDGVRDCEDSCPFDATRWRIAQGACGVFSSLEEMRYGYNRSKTLSGEDCQDWDKQAPHRHNAMESLSNNKQCSSGPSERFPEAASAGTPCVFPFVYNNTKYESCVDRQWCNTNPPGDTLQMSPCVSCPEQRRAARGVGAHSHCLNYDDSPDGPWCFTTDPLTRSERCFPPELDVSNYSVVLAGSNGLISSNGAKLVASPVNGAALVHTANPDDFFHKGCIDTSSLDHIASVNQGLDIAACRSTCSDQPQFAITGGSECVCLSKDADEDSLVHIAPDEVESGCTTSGIGLDKRVGIPCQSTCEQVDIGNGATVGVCFTDSMRSVWARCTCKRSCNKRCGVLPCGAEEDAKLASVYVNSGLCEEQPCYLASHQVAGVVSVFSGPSSIRRTTFASSTLAKPGAVMRTADGKILVADEEHSVIYRFTSQLVVHDVIPLLLRKPSKLEFAEDGDALFVSAQDAGQVYKIEPSSEGAANYTCRSLLFEGGWQECDSSSFASFEMPQGIVVADKIVYVCEELQNSVYLFDSDSGKFLGKSPEIERPMQVARIDEAMFVLHRSNLLARFTGDGTTIEQVVLGVEETADWTALIINPA